MTMETMCCGGGGIEELRKKLPDENAPCYGMLRLTVGEGAFARQKTVMLIFAPDTCPGIKKAKFAAKRSEAKKALGDVHFEWNVAGAGELSVAGMLEATKHIAADSTKGDFSITKMKADYEAMIVASAKAGSGGIGGGGTLDLMKATGRKTASEMGSKVNGHVAIKAVREQLGPFNWALFGPTEAGQELKFINAGSLSVNECIKWLKDDENYCGILRMGFGQGRFRRTKWIFFTFSGPKVGVVKRSKAQSSRAAMKAALGPASVDLQVTSLDELTLELCIDKVKKLPGVDGEQVNESNEISLDNFVKALQEEANAAATFFGDNDAVQTGALRPVAAVVEELRKGTGINWALFTTDGKGMPPSAATPTPSLSAATPPTTTTPTPTFPAPVLLSKPQPASSASSASSSTTPLLAAAAAAAAPVKPATGKLAGGSWMKPTTSDSSDTTPIAASTKATPAVGKISVAASAMFGGGGGARKSVDSVSAPPVSETVVPVATVPDAVVVTDDATAPEVVAPVVVAVVAVPEVEAAAAVVKEEQVPVVVAAAEVVSEVVSDVKTEVKTEVEEVKEVIAQSEIIPKQTVAEE